MRQISKVDFILSDQEQGERNLVHDAWYSVDRIGAENLLSGKPLGAYLFRRDLFAKELEDRLNEESMSPISCLTLTYSDEEGKISEKTLVCKEGKWLIYDDDPTLSEVGYDTVKQLIENQAPMLKTPLLHRRAA
jgi:hypothetical protein